MADHFSHGLDGGTSSTFDFPQSWEYIQPTLSWTSKFHLPCYTCQDVSFKFQTLIPKP